MTFLVGVIGILVVQLDLSVHLEEAGLTDSFFFRRVLFCVLYLSRINTAISDIIKLQKLSFLTNTLKFAHLMSSRSSPNGEAATIKAAERSADATRNFILRRV